MNFKDVDKRIKDNEEQFVNTLFLIKVTLFGTINSLSSFKLLKQYDSISFNADGNWTCNKEEQLLKALDYLWEFSEYSPYKKNLMIVEDWIWEQRRKNI